MRASILRLAFLVALASAVGLHFVVH